MELIAVLDNMEQDGLTYEQIEAIGNLRQSVTSSWTADIAPGAGSDPLETSARDTSMTRDLTPDRIISRVESIEIINGPANIRRGPSTSYPPFMLAPVGFIFPFVSRVDDWYQVKVANESGFVHQSLVKEVASLDEGPESFEPGTGDKRSIDSFDEASENFADSFKGPWSFGCLDQHQICRTKHAWYDCDLVLLSCIGESWLRAF
jgi:hypothetical protein